MKAILFLMIYAVFVLGKYVADYSGALDPVSEDPAEYDNKVNGDRLDKQPVNACELNEAAE